MWLLALLGTWLLALLGSWWSVGSEVTSNVQDYTGRHVVRPPQTSKKTPTALLCLVPQTSCCACVTIGWHKFVTSVL